MDYMEMSEADFDAAMAEGTPVELEVARSEGLYTLVLTTAVGVAASRSAETLTSGANMAGTPQPIPA